VPGEPRRPHSRTSAHSPNSVGGQQAMALAMIYPESEQGKQRDPQLRKKLTMLGKTEEAGAVRLRQARTVLRHSYALALAGYQIPRQQSWRFRSTKAGRPGDRAAPPGSGNAAMLRRGQLRLRLLARNCPRRGHRSRATIGAGTAGLPFRW
jgi:hypothetical protein